MRASSRFGGNRKPAAGKPQGSAAEDSDDGGGAASSSMRAPQASSAASAGDDSDDADGDEDLGAMRTFFPVSFGKKKEVKRVAPEAHQSTAGRLRGAGGDAGARRGGVQFGPRATDAATSAGASQRAARAEAQAKQDAEAAAAAAAVARMGIVEQRGESDAEEEAPDEVPAPGREAEVIPVTHEVAIPGHAKAVTAMSLDPKGSRMVTGGLDGVVRYYDFNGMSEAKEPFRIVEPVDCHMVQSLSFSTTGGVALVVCSDSHARIYDRDGSSKPVQTTVKGDMYVRDMQHTKGHTQMLTGGMWHPFHSEQWITSSLDGTLRIWDINTAGVGMDQLLPSLHVLKTLDKRNVCVGGASGRAGGLHPCCCAYSPNDAKMIVGGCSDGSVQVFFEKQRYMKPDRILRTAHTDRVTDLGFICRGQQPNLMVTRSLDDTMKVWDTRMLNDAKGPVKTFNDLPCGGQEKAGVCVSPDGKYLVAGTALSKGALGSASIRVYDTQDFRQVKALDFGQKSPIVLKWPGALNQLIVGTSSGEVTMLYSPFSSVKGALHFVGKKAKTRESQPIEYAGHGPIFNMTDKDDIQKFWSTGHGNMQNIRRQETRQAQKTLTPIRPPVQGDKNAGSSDQMAFAALVLKSGAKQLHLNKATGMEMDSQKALLAYADRTKEPSLVDHAYSKTQPTKILDWSEDLSEGDKRMSTLKGGDFCRKCGQKMCRCTDYSEWGSKRQKTG